MPGVWSPIHVAAAKGNFEMAKVLISATEFPNAPDISGYTPRDFALRKMNFRIALLLGRPSLSDVFVFSALDYVWAISILILPFLTLKLVFEIYMEW